jgi:hypothetical protein
MFPRLYFLASSFREEFIEWLKARNEDGDVTFTFGHSAEHAQKIKNIESMMMGEIENDS